MSEEIAREILAELREVSNKIIALESKVSSREEICSIHREGQNKLRESIEGNGSMGIKTQVKILWLVACGAWAILLLAIRNKL